MVLGLRRAAVAISVARRGKGHWPEMVRRAIDQIACDGERFGLADHARAVGVDGPH